MNIVDKYYADKRGEIGSIMAAHQISPGNLTITNRSSISDRVSPKLSWTVNGSENHPNNRFRVVAYDTNGNLLYTSSNIPCSQAYNTIFNYTISTYDWIYLVNQMMLNYYGTFTIKLAVESYQTDEPVSGPYPSSCVSVTLKKTGAEISINSLRYKELPIYLSKGGYCDFYITFGTAGSKLLQTFGTINTYMEVYDNTTGTRLEYDDDDGYSTNAFIRRVFEANKVYRIRVRFYDSDAYGSTKLVITPTTWLINPGSSSISCYEDIWTVTGKTSYSLSTSIALNSTKALVFTPPSDGSYTFETTGSIDTYMYVLDPRSSTPVTASDYNDNGGTGTNARLTKTLKAGVPYIVFYSAYDISSSSSTGSMSLVIKKS